MLKVGDNFCRFFNINVKWGCVPSKRGKRIIAVHSSIYFSSTKIIHYRLLCWRGLSIKGQGVVQTVVPLQQLAHLGEEGIVIVVIALNDLARLARDGAAGALFCSLGGRSHCDSKVVLVIVSAVAIARRSLPFACAGVVLIVALPVAHRRVARVDHVRVVRHQSRSVATGVGTALPVATTVLALIPRLFERIHATVIASAVSPTVSAARAAPATRLIVMASVSVASVASIASVGASRALLAMAIAFAAIIAAVVVAATIRQASATSSAFAKLAACVAGAACVLLLTKGARERPLCLLADLVELGVLEQSVCLFLDKKRLEVLRQTFYHLGGELFAALHVLGMVGAMVRHVVLLHRQLFAWRLLFAGGELLGDA
jgi:hypothetical protein